MTHPYLREIHRDFDSLQKHLTSAIVSDDTRDAIIHVGAARRAAFLLDRRLHQLDEPRSRDASGDSPSNSRHSWFQTVQQTLHDGPGADSEAERFLIQSARRAIVDLINCTRHVEVAADIIRMREAAVTCKSHSDFADAYLALAVGFGDSHVAATGADDRPMLGTIEG